MPFVYFFNDTASTEIYTLSLHDALPIFSHLFGPARDRRIVRAGRYLSFTTLVPCPVLLILDLGRPERFLNMLRIVKLDRKSTRLNSSHANISYAVFCLLKQNITLALLY